VKDLHHYVCPQCSADFVDAEQSRHNLVVTQIASGETPSFILPADIKTWRDSLSLTQREAARILGGGTNAFSKYETGEVTQSDAMDNLLWLVIKHPELLSNLAGRRKIPLSKMVSNSLRLFDNTLSKHREVSGFSTYRNVVVFKAKLSTSRLNIKPANDASIQGDVIVWEINSLNNSELLPQVSAYQAAS